MNRPLEFTEKLRERFSLAGSLSVEQAKRLERHFELLTKWNAVINLTSIRSMEEAIVRHYCESLFLALHLPAEPVSVLDIGSGAGFPGVPMAAVRPDCQFTLAESHSRKAAFLREATRDWENVRVVFQRAESLTAGFDWVVSRAVAWKDLGRFAGRLGGKVALLLSSADVDKVRSSPGFEWLAPEELPWGQKSVLLIGVRRFT